MGRQTWWKKIGKMAAGLAVLAIVPAYAATAQQRFTSPNYTIDASVGNTFGGSTSSANYQMVSSGGETIVGNGSGGSYKLTSGYVAQLEKSLQLTVQPSGLAAYYPLDEGTGSGVNDETANNNRGDAVNGPTWTTGKVGQSLTFNGSNQAVSVSSGSSMNIETVTVEGWFKTSQAPAADISLIEKWGGTGVYPYAIRLTSTGKAAFVASDGTNTPVAASTTSINNGAWNHVIGTRTKNGDMKIYINGVLEATVTDTTTVATTNTTAVTLANRSDGVQYFNGSLDELKIFNRALTATEIKAEYNAGNAGIPAGLSFPAVLTSGTPQTVDARAVVQTDAPGYNLALSQNQNLTNGSYTIPAVNNSGTIATPAAWTTGSTKGLGFSLTTASPGLDTKWGSGANYAALPGSATTFFSRSGYTAGGKDTLDIRYKLDVTAGQAAGSYTNTVTYTGTMVP